MIRCRVEMLVRLLAGKLNLNSRLSVLDHLDQCKLCREVYFNMSRDRDGSLFVRRPYNVERAAARRT